ncbi:MAG: translation initiation factor IF-2 [Hymenobacteraceae bacterium]|nr:translation initiation factor IF-2 [Hymenobacteraceae bacterium]
MAEQQAMRLGAAATKFNVGRDTLIEFLTKKGHEVLNNVNTKLTPEQIVQLTKQYGSDEQAKIEANKLSLGKTPGSLEDDAQRLGAQKAEINPFLSRKDQSKTAVAVEAKTGQGPAVPPKTEPTAAPTSPAAVAPVAAAPAFAPPPATVPGLTVLGKIELDAKGRVVPPRPATPPAPVKPTAQVAAPAQPVVAEAKPSAPVPAATQAPVEPVQPATAVPTPAPAALVAVPAPPAPIAIVQPPAAAPEVKPDSKPKASPPAQAVAPPEPIVATPSASAPPVVTAKAEAPPVAPTAPAAPVAPETPDMPESEATIVAKADKLQGLTVLGKIELPLDGGRRGPGGRRPVASSDVRKSGLSGANATEGGKKKRARLTTPGQPGGGGGGATDQQSRPLTTPAGGGYQQRGPMGGPGGQRGPGAPRTGGPGGPRTGGPGAPRTGAPGVPGAPRVELTDKQIQDQIKNTLARLSGGGNRPQINSRRKGRVDRRARGAEQAQERERLEQAEAGTLKLTEFISANDLASLMNVSVNEIIKVCMGMGMFVSINQRLDAEAITVIADEFGFDVEFLSAEEEETSIIKEDDPATLLPRAPIVTIMGHVDHGKTSLLDYIRSAKVAKGEAGGITQHIGAYEVTTKDGRQVTFLDTPGHEAFTAMRARGAKVTDIAVIVVAADDSVVPQTKEAINHAQAAQVPIVIALNKMDKPAANPEKIKEELSQINILVEDWGGKYQSQGVSAKSGMGIDELLEKVLLEAELLDLKANPDRAAVGTVVEASLDKGRGYVTTVLVQTGTLKIGDIVVAGANYGRVKAMTDHRGKKMKGAGPSMPVQVLGFDGAPQAGDKFVVMETEREARELATQRQQLAREQSIRTKKHITLDEIGRRLAIGTFKELNVIVKGDVDGSVEALADSLLKLSTPEVQVRILLKGVGQISENDVQLASASDAIIIGFQVRPSQQARKLADQEQIDIRLYSIIYNAINEVKDAMEGLLAPTVQEVVTATLEVRMVFDITKVGTIAGCMVTDGVINRNSKIRLVRDGIVLHTGDVLALKRFKDDVSEVRQGYDCGVSFKGFNAIQEGDTIEAFKEEEVKRTL